LIYAAFLYYGHGEFNEKTFALLVIFSMFLCVSACTGEEIKESNEYLQITTLPML